MIIQYWTLERFVLNLHGLAIFDGNLTFRYTWWSIICNHFNTSTIRDQTHLATACQKWWLGHLWVWPFLCMGLPLMIGYRLGGVASWIWLPEACVNSTSIINMPNMYSWNLVHPNATASISFSIWWLACGEGSRSISNGVRTALNPLELASTKYFNNVISSFKDLNVQPASAIPHSFQRESITVKL